jgi:hypothetical protein
MMTNALPSTDRQIHSSFQNSMSMMTNALPSTDVRNITRVYVFLCPGETYAEAYQRANARMDEIRQEQRRLEEKDQRCLDKDNQEQNK